MGLELRPGFLGKWIEISVVNTEGHSDVVSYFKSRFLKPAIELRTKLSEKEMFKDSNLVKQQKKIEEKLTKKTFSSSNKQNLAE